MKRIRWINTVHAVIVIIVGLVNYFVSTTQDATLLIIPGIGLALLGYSFVLERSRMALHTAGAITVLLAIFIARFFMLAVSPEAQDTALTQEVLNRRMIIYGILTISSFVAILNYALVFMRGGAREQ
jgi:hypothetical protein